MRFLTRVAALAFFILTMAATGFAQAAGSVRGNVFEDATAGLTYTLPAHFFPKVGNELPQTVSGTEVMILALWDSPERSGLPRITFLYDAKPRPAAWSREQIALDRLREVRESQLQEQGIKVANAKRIPPPGPDMWRLDYVIAADPAPYNSVIAIPLNRQRVLTVQINARSRSDLEAEVGSLRSLQVASGKP